MKPPKVLHALVENSKAWEALGLQNTWWCDHSRFLRNRLETLYQKSF